MSFPNVQASDDSIRSEKAQEHNFSTQTEHLNGRMSQNDALDRIRTAGAVSIPPELFEKLYLSPQTAVKGELRRTFANPTPIALAGFLLALTPLSCDLMGWRGAGGTGAASIGAYWFFGGVLMLLGGILEWIIGNTFPAAVFSTFGAFYLTFAATLTPTVNAYAAYASASASSPAEGLTEPGFNASFGFFLLFMGCISFVYLICALRTNICFVIIFLTLTLAFGLLTGAYWALAADFKANAAYAGKLVVGGGACAFVCCLSGWWIFIAIMLETLDFPFQIPVGDLSTVIRGRSSRLAADSKV